MKITLNGQEVLKAIETYMLLKGYKTGNGFEFSWDKRYGGLKGVEFDVMPLNISLEKIKDYANK
ncbi:hypothetical protein [Rossellomorea marisflavi]|uniref:hypothetical protein n=1 Tax=Rossellomorea marisflavi TaxID=189381 RepID=UPI00345CC94E